MEEKDGFVKVNVNMPKKHHRKLKAIAALKGIGLSTYIMECVEKAAFREKNKESANEESVEIEDPIKEVERLVETN